MKLSEALQEKKKQILSIWIDRTLDSYTSSDFFKRSSDQIANPIGANIRAGLTTIMVMTGVSTPADLAAAPCQPDYAFAGLPELMAALDESGARPPRSAAPTK